MPYAKSTMTVDNSGNIYLTGMFEDTVFFGGRDNFVVPLDSTDFFIAKINPDGLLLWTKIISGMGAEWLHDIEVDQAGNTFFIGDYGISLKVDTLYIETGAGIEVTESYLCKLNPDGKLLKLRRSTENNEDIILHDLEIDQQDNLYLMGRARGDKAFNITFNHDSLTDIYSQFVACINKSFEGEWLVTICDSAEILYPGGYGLSVIKTDPQDHLYISGYGSGDNDALFISKLKNDGSVIWTDTIHDIIYKIGGIFTDRDGNVYLTGDDYGFFTKFSPEGEKLWMTMIESRVWTSVVNPDGYTIATYFHNFGTLDGFIIIDPNGNIIYDYPFEGIEVEQLAMDEAGNIYYNGYFLDGITVNEEVITTEQGNNYVIGTLKLAEIIGGAQNEAASHYTSLHLFPNPVINFMTLKTNQGGSHNLEIITLNGKTVYNDIMQGNDMQIDMSSFSKGIYFITIRSKDFVKTEKIIKL